MKEKLLLCRPEHDVPDELDHSQGQDTEVAMRAGGENETQSLQNQPNEGPGDSRAGLPPGLEASAGAGLPGPVQNPEAALGAAAVQNLAPSLQGFALVGGPAMWLVLPPVQP